MINTAVILAAGLGSRLKSHTKAKPKGFLEIEGKSLVRMSVDKLIAAGIERIIIGTGYMSEWYEELALSIPQIECKKNLIFEETGSMHTLFNLKDLINGDFLLLESDLLYDKSGIRFLLDDAEKNIILASGKTNSNDEVFIEANKENYLINMSKNKDALNSIHSELVGITKLSNEFYLQMCKEFAKVQSKNSDYESIIVSVSSRIPVKVLKIDDYAWCEIDDENHLARAINLVNPLIKAREQLA